MQLLSRQLMGLCFLSAFLFVSVASSPLGPLPEERPPPDARPCTLIGCVPEARIDIVFPAPLTGSFWVDIIAEAQGIGVRCEIGDAGPGMAVAQTPETRTPDGVADNQTASALCREDRVEMDGWAPASLLVRIEGDFTATQFFDAIEYLETQPNGPGCEPTCREATVAFDAVDGGPPDAG